MTYPLKGLVLHLHSALADNGRSEGNNAAPVTSWFDLTYGGHNALLNNYNPPLDKGWTGKNTLADPFSLNFNGTSNHAIVSRFDGLQPKETGFTFEVWLKPANSGYVLSFGGEGEQGFSLYYDNPTRELRARVTTATKQMLFNFSDVEFNKWAHFALTFDGQRLWGAYNAAPQGFSLPIGGTYDYPTGYDLTLGKNSKASNGYFKGDVALVRVYDRHIDFEEISGSYSSRYLVTSTESDLITKGLILYRSELEGNLNVSIMGKATAKYTIKKNHADDLTSTISVTKYDDFSGSLNVNAVAYARSHYEILGFGEEDLEGSISVKRSFDLPAQVSVKPSARMVAKYGIQDITLSELPSTIDVRTYPAHLWSYLTVDMKEVGMRVSYSTGKAPFSDLGGSLSVTKHDNLPSSLQVSSTSHMRAKYKTDGIHIDDLQGSVNVRATSELKSSLIVGTRASMRASYGVSGIIIDDLPSSIIVPSTSDMQSSISVSIKSHMTAHYETTPLHLYDLPSELGVKEFSELYGSMFVAFETKLRGRYGIEPIYFSWLPSEITVRAVDELPSKMFVSKAIVLRGQYELRERPNFKVKLPAVKDAYVREFFPRINYGKETQLYVGKAGSPFPERFRSLVGFDLSSIPVQNTEVGKAVLRLYYDGRGEGTQDVQVLEPNTNWNETGVTWTNQPSPVSGFSVVSSVGGKARYVEFDVTPLVKAWHTGKKPNYGFLLKALDESRNLLRGFYTKEAVERIPELEITYYDMQVYSDYYSSIPSDITVRQNKDKDLKGSLTVKQYNFWNDLPSSFKVHQPNEIESIVWINRPQISGSLTVRCKGEGDLPSTIAVRTIGADDLEGSISANETEKQSSIYVLYRDDLDSSISVRAWGNPDTDGSQLSSTIGVSEVNKSSSIYVLYRDDLESNLGVRVWSDDTEPQNNLPMEFEVTRSFELPGSLEIKEKVQLDGSVSIRVESHTDQPSEVYVKFRDDLAGYGNIGNPNLKSSIEVWEKSLLKGSITVRHNKESDLPSNITIPLGGWSQIPSTVNLRMMYDVPGSVVVNSGNLQSFLTVPINGKKDIVSVLSVRVRRAADLGANFDVNSGNFYSEISVRVDDINDLKGSINVSQESHDDLPIEGQIRNWVNLFSNIAVSKKRYRDLASEITVRQSDESTLDGTISVRQWGDPYTDGGQLVGTISVRVWSEHDQASSIAVRRDDKSDLGGYIQAKQVSDMDSSIAVRQSDLSDLGGFIAVHEHFELYGDITVRRWGDPDRDGGQIPATVTVRQTDDSDLAGTIELFEHSNTPGTITVRQREESDLGGTIAVRVWNTAGANGAQILCTLTVRQKGASDLRTQVSVRRDGKSDLPVIALIKRVSDLEGHIEVVTAYPYAYIM